MSKPFPCCCNCIHCSDYTGTWDGTFAGVQLNSIMWANSGSSIESFLNSNVFTFSLTTGTPITNGIVKTLTAFALSSGPYNYTFLGDTYAFSNLTLTLDFVDLCNGRRYLRNLRVRGDGSSPHGSFTDKPLLLYVANATAVANPTTDCSDLPIPTTYNQSGGTDQLADGRPDNITAGGGTTMDSPVINGTFSLEPT